MNIEVLDYTTEDELNVEHWGFWINADIFHSSRLRITLDKFAVLTKPTKRHKFGVVRSWQRPMTRDNTMEKPEFIPETIKDRVIEHLLDRIEFVDADSPTTSIKKGG